MSTIYFCGSIRAGRQDADLYQRIINKLKKYGNVLTEHIGSDKATAEDASRDDKFIHDRDLVWLNESTAVVAEVTQPSLGVGYELGRAVAMEKKVLCLYRPQPDKSLSAMIRGANNDRNFLCKDYDENELDTILKNFFQTIVGINPEAVQEVIDVEPESNGDSNEASNDANGSADVAPTEAAGDAPQAAE